MHSIAYDLCELRLHKRHAGPYVALGNDSGTWREVFRSKETELNGIYEGAIAAVERLDPVSFVSDSDTVPPLDAMAATLQRLINASANATMRSEEGLLREMLQQGAAFWSYLGSVTQDSRNLFASAAAQTALSLVDFLSRFGVVFVSALRILFEGLSRVVVAVARVFARVMHSMAEWCGSAVSSVVVAGGNALLHVVLVGALSMMEVVKLAHLAHDDVRAYLRSQSVEVTRRLNEVPFAAWGPAAWIMTIPGAQKIARVLGLVSATIGTFLAALIRYTSTVVSRVLLAVYSFLPNFVGYVMQRAVDIIAPLLRDVVKQLHDATQTMTDLQIPLATSKVHVDAAQELLNVPQVSEENKQRLRDSLYTLQEYQRLLGNAQRSQQRHLIKNPRQMANKITAMARVIEELSAANEGKTDGSEINMELADEVMTIEFGMTMEEFAVQHGLVQEQLKAAVVCAVADLADEVPLKKSTTELRRRRQNQTLVEGRLFGNKKLVVAQKEVADLKQLIADNKIKLSQIRSKTAFQQRMQTALAEAKRIHLSLGVQGNAAIQRSVTEIENEQIALVNLSEGITQLEREIREAEVKLEMAQAYVDERAANLEYYAGMVVVLAIGGVIAYYVYQWWTREERELERQRRQFDTCIRRWSTNDPWLSSMLRKWRKDPSYKTIEADNAMERLDGFQEFLQRSQREIAEAQTDPAVLEDKEKMREYQILGREVWRSFARDAKVSVARHNELIKDKASLLGKASESGIWIYEQLIGSWTRAGTGKDAASGGDRLDIVVQESLQAGEAVAAITSGEKSTSVPALVNAAKIEFPTIFGRNGVSAMDPSRFLQGVEAYATPSTSVMTNGAARLYLTDLSEMVRLRLYTMQSALDNYSDGLIQEPSLISRAWDSLKADLSAASDALVNVSGFGSFNMTAIKEDPVGAFSGAMNSINPVLLPKLLAGCQTTLFGVTTACGLILLIFWTIGQLWVGFLAGEGALVMREILAAWRTYGALLTWGTAQTLVHFSTYYLTKIAGLGWLLTIFQVVFTLFWGPIGAGFWAIAKTLSWSGRAVAGILSAAETRWREGGAVAYRRNAAATGRMLNQLAASDQPNDDDWDDTHEN